MITGIYTITNLINSKIYVGSSVKSIPNRLKAHINLLKRNKHHSKYLQNAWNKYGESNFKFEILEEHLKEYCLGMEQYWINMLNTANPKYGYNVCPVAGNQLGSRRSDESKLKMRNSALGRKFPKEVIDRRSATVRAKHPKKLKLKDQRLKEIIQCDLNGFEIKEFNSISEAAREVKGDVCGISIVCNKKFRTAYGFKWKLK